MFWTKMMGVFLIKVIVRGSTTGEMYQSTPEDCKSGELFWFGVVMKASCTTFIQLGHVLHLAVSAFLCPYLRPESVSINTVSSEDRPHHYTFYSQPPTCSRAALWLEIFHCCSCSCSRSCSHKLTSALIVFAV
jgi:hypothetical protein